MTFKAERLPHEPIIVVTCASPFDAAKEAPQMCDKIDSLIAPDETKIFCINDFREIKLDFGSVVAGMAVQRQKRPGAAGDPRLSSLLVGSGMMWELVSKGAKQLQYGGIDVPLFSSMDEALAHAREKIRTW